MSVTVISRPSRRNEARAPVGDPSSAAAYTERGILRLGRHDFRGGLIDGERARSLAPGVVSPDDRRSTVANHIGEKTHLGCEVILHVRVVIEMIA